MTRAACPVINAESATKARMVKVRVKPEIRESNASYFSMARARQIGTLVRKAQPDTADKPDCTLVDFGNSRFWIEDRFLEEVE